MSVVTEQDIISNIKETVLSTDGVSSLTENLTEQLSKSILGISSPNKGIKISKDKMGMVIDIFVSINYGENIPEISWNIQENVANALKTQFQLNISKIDIHVQGVTFKRKINERKQKKIIQRTYDEGYLSNRG